MNEHSVHVMEKQHADDAARLHRLAISKGFLSTLGPRFLKQLYAAIPSCPAGFGYVWEEDGRVLGFVALTTSTGTLYKQALLRRGVLMAVALLPKLFRPSVLKRICETLKYPLDVAEELPRAELLSIGVEESSRGRGIGKALVQVAREEFRKRGIQRVKVAVGAANEGANSFYTHCGFALKMKRQHHGLPMNLYVLDTEH